MRNRSALRPLLVGVSVLSGAALLSAGAAGQDLSSMAALRFEAAASPAADLSDRSFTVGESAAVDLAASAAIEVQEGKAAGPRFGQPDGTWWLNVTPAVGTTFGKETTAGARVGLFTFVAENIQVGGEAGVWEFQQPGDNAWGVNAMFVLRWHFYNEGNWTWFLDAGIGGLVTSSDVPTGGTSFNLMPRAGAGFTYRLTDGGARLEAGLGWHHVSNARINGDDENPSRDLPMLHVGLVFPL
jgi:hypothetical protein